MSIESVSGSTANAYPVAPSRNNNVQQQEANRQIEIQKANSQNESREVQPTEKTGSSSTLGSVINTTA